MVWMILFLILAIVLLVSLNRLSPQDSEPSQQTDLHNTVLDSMPDDYYDDGLTGIFMEETHEILSEINNLLIDWQEAPDNKTIQADIRQRFHMLKGSGRLVGANAFADVSHSVEQIFNHLLDNNITVTAELMDCVSDASQQMQILASDFENKQPPTDEYKMIIEKAVSFAT